LGNRVTAHIALLRAVNVGGKNLVSMAALKAMMEELGFAGARSLLQSGNLIFDAGRRKPDALEILLEKETAKRFDASPDYFVRDAAEWSEVVAHNPFPREAKDDPGRLHVLTLKAAPSAVQVNALRAAIKGPETVRTWTRHAYIYYPDGAGNSKLTPRLIETKLETRGTARNWNTALKLQALASDL
jgi:uncharacterized protein (DUF1697 family)